MQQPPPQQGGLAPSVANLFAQHQQQQQQPQQHQFQPPPLPHMLQQQPPPHHLQQQHQFQPPQMHAQHPHPHMQHGPPQGPPGGPFGAFPPHPQQLMQHPQQQGPPMPMPPHMQQQPPMGFHPQHLQHQQGPPHQGPPQPQFQHFPSPPGGGQMQLYPQQGPYQTPPPPPPSRQVSELQLPPQVHVPMHIAQVSGPGSLLSAAPVADDVAAVVGVPLAPFGTLDFEPAAKQLGGEEHAATPCTEFSSIPRELDTKAGCLIAHADQLTLFALKNGLVRLVYQRDEDNKQMEVLKGGHTSAVIDMAFMPLKGTASSNGVRHAATLSTGELCLYRFEIVDDKCEIKLVVRLTKDVAFARMRFQPVGAQYLAVVFADEGDVFLLDVEDLLRNPQGDANEAWEQLKLSGIEDVTWSTGGSELFLTGSRQTFEYSLVHDAVASVIDSTENERVLSVANPGGAPLLLIAASGLTKLRLVLAGPRPAIVSTLSFPQAHIINTCVEVDPTGSFVLVAYRRAEPTGESSDQGFYVLTLTPSVTAGDAHKVFNFATVFFQPSPILSASIVGTASGFDVYAVEQKPIVQLRIAASTVYRALTLDEQRSISTTRSVSVPLMARSVTSLNQAISSSGALEGADEEDEHHYEAKDAVPALRSELRKLSVAQQEVAQESVSPPTPNPTPQSAVAGNGVLLGTPSSTGSSTTSSASNSRMQSPGVYKGERPEFSPLEQPLDTTHVDYHSGRSSPAMSASPAKPIPILRPRASSTTDSRVHFQSSSAPSSQPTPASTPAPPGTPVIRSSTAGSEVCSPLPSPRMNHHGTPPSPSPFRHSTATTADGSALGSPLISSPSSPLISPRASPTPTAQLDDSGVGGIQSIPSTPMQLASSTPTPAPTPLALSAGVRLSQMSSADVSLHLATASMRDGRASAGSGAPTNTPMNTPANSVPSTPRLAGISASGVAQQRSKSSAAAVQSAVPVPVPANLRVRTQSQSGSTSPSPISSPMLHPHPHSHSYMKMRSASMDRNDSNSRLSGTDPLHEEGGDEDKQRSVRPSATQVSSGKEKQEQTLMLRMDQLFARHHARLGAVQSQERLEMTSTERARFESLTADLMNTVRTEIAEVVQDTVLPSLESSISHAVQTGQTILSAAIVAGLQLPLQESFRTLLPSFEQQTKVMCAQIQMGALAAATRGDQARDAQLVEMARKLEAAKQEHATQMADMVKSQAQMMRAIAGLSQQVADLTKVVQANAGRPPALSLNAASASQPPPPPATPTTVDTKQEVASLLAAEQFERAFTVALTSGKLPCVLYACEQVDPRTLLSHATPAHHRLSAPVLLSLIQQLSVDLSAGPSDLPSLRVKLLWLFEAVAIISANDPALRGHAAPMLRDLIVKLEVLAQQAPSQELAGQVHMTLRMAQSKLA